MTVPATRETPRVLMVGPAMEARGGMTTVIDTYLANWDRSRYDVRYVGTYSDTLSGIAKITFYSRALLRYGYQVIRQRPSLVHIHASQRGSYIRKGLMALMAIALRIPVIWHSHGSEFEAFQRSLSGSGQGALRWLLNQTAVIIVLSEAWRTTFENLELRPEIKVLHNPTPFAIVDSGPKDLDAKQPIVLTLGRLGKRKGTYDTLAAIPAILARCPDAEFWLAGDGEIVPVQTEVDASGLGASVKLPGWVQGDAKTHYLETARLFLLPSYNEGLPMAILEAMSYGLPVISTDVGGIPEMVDDGITGYLVSPGDVDAIADRVAMLLEDSRLAEQLGRNGQQKVKSTFAAGPIMRDLYQIYDTILMKSDGNNQQ